MSKLPKVSIVVLTWNGLKLTLDVLKDIGKLKTAGLSAETIVVDNGSKDKTQEKLRQYKLPNMAFRLIENKKNLGFAEGNNVGMRDAIEKGADYVLLMNNDVIVPSDFLVQLIEVAKADKKIGLLAPKMYFAKGYEFHKRSLLDPSKDRYKRNDLGKVIWYAGGLIDWDNIYASHRGVDEVDKGQYDRQEKTVVVNAACALIRKEVIKDIGYLDKELFAYWEDADYSERARRAGWWVVYTPKVSLWHKVAQTSGIGSDLNDYFLTRNRLVFGMRYARLRTKLALIRESFRLILFGRKWQKIGTVDFYLRRMGRGSWGKK